MPTTLYFDLVSGASGDMILATLVDLGLPVPYLNTQLKKLKIPGLKVGSSRVNRNGVMCAQMKMEWKTARQYRYLPDILTLIRNAKFPDSVMDRCEQVLDRLADAESKVHGIPKEQVHFHEIGAIDTIVDIVGACLGFDYLKVQEIKFSALVEGHGTIQVAHGIMPIPVPATERLMRGFIVRRINVATELLTPTGCALLTTLGKQEELPDDGTVMGTGYGCGTKVFQTHPNYLRAFLITQDSGASKTTGQDTIALIETDMDHISGEIMGATADLLLSQGALDVAWIPIFMKKGRPAYRLSVMVPIAQSSTFVDLIMLHTRTLGVRVQIVKRILADRKAQKGKLLGHTVREKVCSYKGRTFKKIENDDLVALAAKLNVPIIDLLGR